MDSLRAYNCLESAILTGQLKPRERLVEQELAERLKMSRTPIREALRRLEVRGLVRIVPRRGAIVSDISPAEVENIYVVRSLLEVLASRLAVERIAPGEIEKVGKLEAAHAALATRGDVRALMLANDRFHDAIYCTAQNACLFEMIQQLRRQVHPVRFHAWSQPDRITRSIAEHKRMVDFLRQRNGEQLASLAREHLRVAKETYLAYLGASSALSAGVELAEAAEGKR